VIAHALRIAINGVGDMGGKLCAPF